MSTKPAHHAVVAAIGSLFATFLGGVVFIVIIIAAGIFVYKVKRRLLEVFLLFAFYYGMPILLHPCVKL